MSDAKTMTNEERAKKASNERWHPIVPKATHSGILNIAGQEIQCDVLNDGRRVLRQKNVLKAMGKGSLGRYDQKKGKELNLPIFLTANNLIPYLEPDFMKRGELIFYKSMNGKKIQGYDAKILTEACKIYVKADDDKALFESQKSIAKVCRSMLYGLATIGIISLVDDATGFVEQRNRNELQEILDKYISEELRAWTRKFPDEFFKQVYKIHGWNYSKTGHHPQYLGKFINKYIYEKLPPMVLQELQRKNPCDENGVRKHRHHQFLTDDIGDDNLKKQLVQTITLMKVSENVEQFKQLMEKV